MLRQHKYWKPDEVEYLQFHAPVRKPERIAEELGRTVGGVFQKARQLDWSGYLISTEVGKVLGIDHSLASKWMLQHGHFGRLISLPHTETLTITRDRLVAFLSDAFYAWLGRLCEPPEVDLARLKRQTWQERRQWYVTCDWLAEECVVQRGTVHGWIRHKQLPATPAPLGRCGPRGYLIPRPIADVWADCYVGRNAAECAAAVAEVDVAGFDAEVKAPWREVWKRL